METAVKQTVQGKAKSFAHTANDGSKEFIMSQFSHKYSQKTPHNSPARARYGVSNVDPASGWWYSASVPVIIYVIS